eukprot:gb/GECG01013414.1/.p1 GENE.gb/GECG01013414.1/~~gb/GECG01013414.1/.p1  ORF type:complete len:371 (+),score=47.25 gb/GECG01013414.1/:1-1113(+)
MSGDESTPPLLLPSHLLWPTPSYQQAQIDYETNEKQHRIFGCELISEAGILLKLPQACIATAETLLQRFYYRVSLSQYDVVHASMAALFLAAKVEDQLDDHKEGRTMRMRDVLNVFFHIKRKRLRKTVRPLSLGCRLYNHWKDRLTKLEVVILKELGFSMYNIMEHPHKYILYYVRALEGTHELARNAWAYLNDSLRLDLCVRFRAESIACAAIYLASRKLEQPLPMNPPWYKVFNTSDDEIFQISAEVLQLYEEPRVTWLPSLCEPRCNYDHMEKLYEEEEDNRIEADFQFDQKVQAERKGAPSSSVDPRVDTTEQSTVAATDAASKLTVSATQAKVKDKLPETKHSTTVEAEKQPVTGEKRRKRRRWK